MKYRLHLRAVVRKHQKGKTPFPSGPCCLASQQSHFYLQPGYWCFVSVSDVPLGRAVGTVPTQEEAGRQEAQQPERARDRSWQLAALDAGAVSILPGLLQFSALTKPKHSEQGKSLSAGWFDLV